jgi:hypothetical protein
MVFINSSQTLGIILAQGTATTTGSLFLSLFVLLAFFLAMALMFQIKLEYTAILILPLLLAYMAFYRDWIAVGTVILIYLAIIFTKNFFIK